MELLKKITKTWGGVSQLEGDWLPCKWYVGTEGLLKRLLLFSTRFIWIPVAISLSLIFFLRDLFFGETVLVEGIGIYLLAFTIVLILSARAKPRESEYSIVRGHLFIRRKEALPFTIKAVGVKRETETSLLVKGDYWKYCHVMFRSAEECDRLHATMQKLGASEFV